MGIDLKEYESEIIEITKVFVNQNNDEFQRGASWDSCYGLAQCMHDRRISLFKEGKDLDDHDYDLMSLSLSNYLFNWGMGRNSFLMGKSYRSHIKPLRTIFANDFVWDHGVSQRELLKFAALLSEDYGLSANRCYSHTEVHRGMTETLFSKILLGLTGNVVAYDEFCRKALSSLGFSSQLYSNSSWDSLVPSFESIKEKMVEIGSKYPVFEFKDNRYVQTGKKMDYPFVKYIDMFLFSLGRIVNLIEKTYEDSTSETDIEGLFDCFENGLSYNNSLVMRIFKWKYSEDVDLYNAICNGMCNRWHDYKESDRG